MSAVSTAIAPEIEAAAKAVGLTLTAAESGTDFAGNMTDRAIVALGSKTETLEMTEGFDATRSARFAPELSTYFGEAAERLKNPRPECYLSLIGLPLSFSNFAWPFHASTSGADTFVVHGEIRLENGVDNILHAKISAALTQTFVDVVAALEQPFAESVVYNAVRKTLDQGQLELVKSGNRQPAPVTTRYYSAKREIFIFNDTDETQRYDFLAAKTFWLSHVLGGDQPVWLADPRDAQYLNTTAADLKAQAAKLAAAGLVTLSGDGAWAVATDALKARRDEFQQVLDEALAFTKPTFNEDMRAGNTNM